MATAGAFITNDSDSFHSMLQNDAEAFYKSLTDRLESSNFRMSIGSMNAYVE